MEYSHLLGPVRKGRDGKLILPANVIKMLNEYDAKALKAKSEKLKEMVDDVVEKRLKDREEKHLKKLLDDYDAKALKAKSDEKICKSGLCNGVVMKFKEVICGCGCGKMIKRRVLS
jgi:hypothetical protein